METFARIMPSSIKDVAHAAGVSYSTVSRALSGSPLVKKETAEHVKEVAKSVRYTASAIGRSLVTGKTSTVGVVVTTIADPFFAELIDGFEEAADRCGLSVVLACSHADANREVSVIRSFQERRLDGILVAASRLGSLYLPLMSEMKIPIVLINHFHASKIAHSVMIDNLTGAREATRHLIELGHNRIAYLGDQSGMQSDTDRFAGYRQALTEADIPFRPEFVVHGDGKPQRAIEAMQQLLSLPKRPTGVFCYNDMSALGALRVTASQQLKVPQDISLVGFDDLFISSYVEPPLTTIRQPMRVMGRQAMDVMLKLLAGEDSDDVITVKGDLIVRSSTAQPSDRTL